MRFPLAFALIILAAMAQAQTGTADPSDLVVLKFSCGALKTGSGMIRSVQEPDPPHNEPFRINQTVTNEPQEIKNRRDMAERRAAMISAETNAGLSRIPISAVYFYRLRVKNSSTKVVKSFAWEYQSTSGPTPSDRQFFCSIKTKANESKEIELFSPLAPSHVVDASKAKDKSEESPDAKVNINQIEYVDGTVWQRHGWNPKTFSDDAVHKVSPGKCIGL